MTIVLVHHAQALDPMIDTQRPLSTEGLAQAEAVAREIAARGVKPAMVWHSGKLRARQTAEAVWRACNPFASFTMVRGLQPGDRPEIIRDAVLRETQDLAIVGHMPNIAGIASLLGGAEVRVPLHGFCVIALAEAGQ